MSGQNAKLPSTMTPASRGKDVMEAETRKESSDGRQYVTFEIAEEEYGVDIMAVREIRAWTGTTRLPNSADYMRGVINLRGIIVPIYDLRSRFGLGETKATKTHVIIIVAVGVRILGILVDAVSDILSVYEGDVQPVPRMDRTIDSDFLAGLVSVEERMVALLAVERLFDLEQLSDLDEKSQSLEKDVDSVVP